MDEKSNPQNFEGNSNSFSFSSHFLGSGDSFEDISHTPTRKPFIQQSEEEDFHLQKTSKQKFGEVQWTVTEGKRNAMILEKQMKIGQEKSSRAQDDSRNEWEPSVESSHKEEQGEEEMEEMEEEAIQEHKDSKDDKEVISEFIRNWQYVKRRQAERDE